jgi:DNA polymerase III epsilon subunit-like protein
MSYIMVDIESDGPIPGDYSMICFGAVAVEPGLERTFYGQLRPISEKFIPEALAVSGFTREQTLQFPEPATVMQNFAEWLRSISRDRLMFISDNNGFDWMFVCWYLHHFMGENIFGFSSRNINDIYHGLTKDSRSSFKKHRITKHDHNPENDARGNAEVLLYMRDKMGYKVRY